MRAGWLDTAREPGRIADWAAILAISEAKGGSFTKSLLNY